MAKKSSHINNETDAEKAAAQEKESLAESSAETEKEEPKEKPVLPRKRLITRNVQLLVSVVITAAVVLFTVTWKVFFDNTIFGQWHLDIPNDQSDTADVPQEEETSDEAVPSINYEFTKDGECIVQLGTMKVEGTYQLGSSEENGSLLSASVFSGNSPIFYGTYGYDVKGNPFTGRRIELIDLYDTDADPMTLEEGNVEVELTPFEDFKTDEKILGKWYDDIDKIVYEFTDDGYMIRTVTGGMEIKHAYSVMDDGYLILKYIMDTEQIMTSSYRVDGSFLYIDDVKLTKIANAPDVSSETSADTSTE